MRVLMQEIILNNFIQEYLLNVKEMKDIHTV